MPGKRRKASGPLSAEELAAIAETSLANAVALIAEARMLQDAGAISRSYSIAVIAAEEFGKSQLAIGTVGGISTDPGYWKAWWSVFYGHGPKLVRAASFARPLLPEELFETFVDILLLALKEQRREVGFYVDMVDGDVAAPSDRISREETAAAIECFSAVIDGYAWVMSQGPGIAAGFLAANASPEAKEMRVALATRDPERIRETFEATTGFRPGDDQLAEIMAMLEEEP